MADEQIENDKHTLEISFLVNGRPITTLAANCDGLDITLLITRVLRELCQQSLEDAGGAIELYRERYEAAE